MNTSIQGNMTVPASPTVWQAIAYAQTQVPLQCRLPKGKSREDLLEGHLIEWLVATTPEDMGVLLRFHIEYDALRHATLRALYGPREGGCDGADYSAMWLILQGERAHRAMVELPDFFDSICLAVEGRIQHEMYPDRHAQQRLLDTGKFAGCEHLLDLDFLVANGIEPEAVTNSYSIHRCVHPERKQSAGQ